MPTGHADGGRAEAARSGIDRENYGGPVDSDVSYFRDSGAVIRYPAVTGVTCHACGSGAVYQPMQPMDLPMILRCLHCGEVAASNDFERTFKAGVDPDAPEGP